MNHPQTSALFKWYDSHKRSLPWRSTTNPYHIWLSEIILQQTRIEQGLSYYLKFTELFPTVQHLANAEDDEVMKAWQGLGYYSRARNLLYTARFISNELNGTFPDNSKDLQKLKGVGPYTAAAIASFAFKEVVPVVDGNVYRLISRLYGITSPIDTPIGHQEILTTVTELISTKQPDVFNQAIMDFGSTHCKTKKPLCSTCPFQDQCVAFKMNLIDQLPLKSKKTKVFTKHLYYLVLSDEKNILVKKRPAIGIWSNLHDFPLIESDISSDIEHVIEKFRTSHPEVNLINNVSEPVQHLLSHRKMFVTFIEASSNLLSRKESRDLFLQPINELEKLAVPKVIENYWKRR
ncbi:MAG: A/G-specific adenine glycosylase [Flavobacteriales bacterium]